MKKKKTEEMSMRKSRKGKCEKVPEIENKGKKRSEKLEEKKKERKGNKWLGKEQGQGWRKDEKYMRE